MDISVASPLESQVFKPTLKQEKFIQVPFEIHEAGYGGALGAGKDLDLNTLVPTPDGFKRMEDIHPGDIVFNQFGIPVKVLAESEIFTSNKCYELEFDSGEVVIAGEDHNWWILTHNDRQRARKQTDKYRAARRASRPSRSLGKRPDLALRNQIQTPKKAESIKGRIATTKELNTKQLPDSIPVALAFDTEDKNLPLHPYVLGAWLGDGASQGGGFTCNDAETLHTIQSYGYKISQYAANYAYRILGIDHLLRSLDLLQNKHIPEQYLFSSENSRLELLRGLMDTDGTIDSKGRCEFLVVNKELALGTLTLIRSLGIKAGFSTGRAKLNGVDYGEKYRINFTTEKRVFNLLRKIERLPVASTFSTRNWHYFKSKKEIPSVSTKCIQVEGGIYLITKSFIPTHNTQVLMLMPALYGWLDNPRFRGLLLRRTFPELEQEVILRSKEYFPSMGGVYNISKHRWEFPRGGMYTFGHLKEEKDVKKYDTGQFPYIAFDEATSFTGYQYEYLTLRRNRAPVGSGLPSIVRWGSNPGNVGHVYFRKRFIDPAPTGGKIIKDPRTGAMKIFIPATAKDNPHLIAANPNYFKNLEQITSEAERRAMILGDWYTFEGQVFEEFRIEPLRDEPNHAQHVVEPFVIPSWWPKIIGIDWGFAAFCFIIWAAISPDGRVYIYRTYAVKKVKIREWTRDLALLSAGEIENVRDIRICWSAVQDRGQDQTIFEQCAESLAEAGFKCGLTLGDKNRVAGKQLVHEYLRWKPLQTVKSIVGEFSQELARRIERMQGSEAMREYASFYEPEEVEHNLPKLQIFSRSPEGNSTSQLTEAISTCVYDEVKKEDVKEFDGDDSYDCLRILLNGCRDYFAEAKNEFAVQQRTGLASKKLAETNDQTSFYRMCEHAEVTQDENISVRRVSRMRRSRR